MEVQQKDAYANWTPSTYANHMAMHRVMESADLLRKKGVGGSAMQVLMVLAMHADKDQPTCWMDYDTLAQESTWSRRTCVDAIAKLEAAKIIKITGKHRSGANQYRLILFDQEPSANLSEKSADFALGVQISPSADFSKPSADFSEQSANLSKPSADFSEQSAKSAYEVVPEVVQGSSAGSSTSSSSLARSREAMQVGRKEGGIPHTHAANPAPTNRPGGASPRRPA